MSLLSQIEFLKRKTPQALATLPWVALAFYGALVWRRAWLSDDAFITLRVVDNYVGGYGLVSNPPERVLGFTHPLWALLLLIPRNLGIDGYWSAMGMSLLVSLACALVVVLGAAYSRIAGALAALWMAGSLAFVDFSTGGLENPLAHLLLAAFFFACAKQELAATAISTWALAALIVLNRQDHLLLVLPMLLLLCAEARAKGFAAIAKAAAIGLLPLVCWLLFALIYYGFALPNTAYAKLNTVLPAGVLPRQGLRYFADAWRRDPLILSVIGLGLLAALRERSRAALALGTGVLVYLLYVWRIGGDFMTGRFFTAPFLVCVVWLAARGLQQANRVGLAVIAAASVALIATHPASLSASVKRPSCFISAEGIVIERQCYAEFTGLSRNLKRPRYQSNPRFQRGRQFLRSGKRVVSAWNIGMSGYAAGPGVHIIDVFALTEPLLARLPYKGGVDFRIGHFLREIPAGYPRTLRKGRNSLKDPCLRAYYDVLSKAITGPLWSHARWQAILDLNLGRYDHLVEKPCPLKAKPAARVHRARPLAHLEEQRAR